MSLTEVIVQYYDLLTAFYFVLAFIILVFLVGVTDFIRAAWGFWFKILVVVFISLACLFVSIFSLAMFYILNDTSFISHIYDGDLLTHLRRGL